MRAVVGKHLVDLKWHSRNQAAEEVGPCAARDLFMHFDKGELGGCGRSRRAGRACLEGFELRLEQRGFSSVHRSLLLQQAQQEGISLAGEYG
jgi:hypothetical protein